MIAIAVAIKQDPKITDTQGSKMNIKSIANNFNTLNFKRSILSLAIAITCQSGVVFAEETVTIGAKEVSKEKIQQLKEAPAIAGVENALNDTNPYLNQNTMGHKLVLKLKNEYRNAERPSASGSYGPEVDAWVQYAELNYRSHNLLSWLDVEAAIYTTQKLHADPSKSTRFYLDGHDNFTLVSGSINIKPIDGVELKVGRYGTDYASGNIDYYVPLIERTSVRPTPSISEGALLKVDLEKFHLYGAYATRYAGGYYTDWQDHGTVQGRDSEGNPIIDKIPKFNIAGVWDNKAATGTELSVGVSYQNDHSTQYMFNAQQVYIDNTNAFWKAELRGLYAQLEGYTKDLNASLMGDGYDDTALLSGQLTYNKDRLTLIGSAGKVGTKLNSITAVDTDLGFSFDQSIDRNHHDMFACQMGTFYQMTPTLQTGIAIVKTDGYEDQTKAVEIDGIGANLLITHKPQGAFEGLRTTLILNKAKEYRTGSALGDELDYYDIKLTFHYDINIL